MTPTPPTEGVEALPEWPDAIKRDGGYHVYKGVRYTVCNDGNSADTARLEDEVAALRARLALITGMIQEYVDQPEAPVRWEWTEERLREALAACKEPSHG